MWLTNGEAISTDSRNQRMCAGFVIDDQSLVRLENPRLRHPRRFICVVAAVRVTDTPERNRPQRLAVFYEARASVGESIIGAAGTGARAAAIVAALL